MKIQVISYDKKIKYGNEHEYTYSSLNAPMSLDAFDLNIISLQSEDLWRYADVNKDSVDSIKDFQSLQPLITAIKKSKAIICFPKNYTYYYNYYPSRKQYASSCQLKDMITQLKSHLSFLLPQGHPYALVYENSKTVCGKTNFDAAFYFSNISSKESKNTKCIGGEHTTTYWANSRLIFTTLDLSKADTQINDFLNVLGLIEQKSDIPTWMDDLKFFDDEEQERNINNARDEIEAQKQKIKLAEEKLEQNLHYKSILFETGDTLVKVVFDILEKMLNCSLADFVDKKGEDFKIALQDITFIGEIKGITSNVKNENVSQLDVHCQTYIDGLDEDGKSENVKGILIINPLRNKPLNERDEVHEKQVQLATRNGSLIITTETLLLLFMAYLQEHITTDKIIELLKNKIGLLSHSDFI